MLQSTSRVREIIAVLRRYNIKKGIDPEKLRLILEELGPTFIKLGQIASLHPDILPQAYCDELSKLCSEVAPMPYNEVVETIERSCGCPWNQIFLWIQEKPRGSASIAQVHRAALRTGEQVVVKVQRQGIYEIISQDVRLLHRLIRFLPPVSIKNMADLDQMLEEIWSAAKEEMDFVMEAANMREFSRRNKGIAFISSPKVYEQYSSAHILVMEYIDGYSIDDKEALLKNGYNLRETAQKLADNYMKQIIYDGFFHADPHAGNIRIRDGKIVWIDLGMMGRLTDKDRQMLTLGLQGIALNDFDMIEEAVLALGEFRQRPDRKKLRDDIENLLNKYGQTGMGNLKLMELLTDLMEIMKENQIQMPHNLTMLVRGLTHMEGVLADLSPDINMIEIARTRIMESIWSPENIEAELKNSGKSILLSLRKAQSIPSSLSDVLQEFKRGEAGMNFNVQATDSFTRLLYHLVYAAIKGLLIAALFIGSSIICTTDMQPQLLGMPLLAAIGYFTAILLSLSMALNHVRKKNSR
ncbi:MAG: AarF/UbiB family protein [Lachnospiraceae bacterium]|nr:AarF/UbiB family protein [Lachnospiraceae bacterium]